ncbi:Tn3 family transposase [Brevibacterium aurantiacum]|uniref:Tn3 family transposase n=1 Tax=Brevibacterium aurantiacum TaxID=273384 RepID=UPI003F92FF03
MAHAFALTDTERTELLAIPESPDELIEHHTLTDDDLFVVGSRRGAVNRLGLAVQICLLRSPGIALTPDLEVPPAMLRWVADQLGTGTATWAGYALREETRWEHAAIARAHTGVESFSATAYMALVDHVAMLALSTDVALTLAREAVRWLRARAVVVPAVTVIERVCGEATARATRVVREELVRPLTRVHRANLDGLLQVKPGGTTTWLTWIRQTPLKTTSKYLLEQIDRLTALRAVDLPEGITARVHQNRLLKLAREGAQMTVQDLSRFEADRRHATLVAIVAEATATVTDQLISMHDRVLQKIFRGATNRHQERFVAEGKALTNNSRLLSRVGAALITARDEGCDPYRAIESVIPWEEFTLAVRDAGELSKPAMLDPLHLAIDQFATLRRYTPAFLEALQIRAAPAAADLLKAVDVIRTMNNAGTRLLPDDAPTGFIRKRWRQLVFTEAGPDRRFYELCVLTELRNALRSGDMWVDGSRQFRDFDTYLMPASRYDELRTTGTLPVAITTSNTDYLDERLALLREQLETVNALATRDELPEASFASGRLKLSPLEASVPDEAGRLLSHTQELLPRVKITSLLVDVAEMTGFTDHFRHIKSGAIASDRRLLLTGILADAINLGPTKMAESCTDVTYPKLVRLRATHLRDETYSAALAAIVNAQHHHPLSQHWGDGTTSSSDGQRFRAGSKATATGHVNPKYGSAPGRLIYTHVSDQYSPFHTQLVNVGTRDATFVLDGLLHHESELRIREHHTDTAGFTDHLFALMHALGYRFAPRIRDLKDTKLFTPPGGNYAALTSMTAGTINTRAITAHWDEILRLVASIRTGTVTASLMLRKLGSYPRQNGLAIALRELGRIERTLFILDWLQNPDLRRRVTASLNKGEARNALARAVFFNRLGELRDHAYDQQRHRASGLNLVTAAISYWNTVHLDAALNTLAEQGHPANPDLIQHLSPLGWEHINLTGDYTWPTTRRR